MFISRRFGVRPNDPTFTADKLREGLRAPPPIEPLLPRKGWKAAPEVEALEALARQVGAKLP